jgi:hypothetical protein
VSTKPASCIFSTNRLNDTIVRNNVIVIGMDIILMKNFVAGLSVGEENRNKGMLLKHRLDVVLYMDV